MEIDSSRRAKAQRSRPPGANPPNAIVFHTGTPGVRGVRNHHRNDGA